MKAIATNIATVHKQMTEATIASGRPLAPTLIAVTKKVDIPQVEEALQAGCTVFGENRVQEAYRKLQQLAGCGSWHLIGHLQSNKVKRAVSLFDLIHSVDSLTLAHEISRRAGEAGKQQDILLQVNTSGEDSKFGVTPQQLETLVRGVAPLPHLHVCGLMTIGAFLPDPESVRPCFKLLRSLRDDIIKMNLKGVSMKHLSMGMTNDYTVAIEEGATLVRVGRAIFGERN